MPSLSTFGELVIGTYTTRSIHVAFQISTFCPVGHILHHISTTMTHPHCHSICFVCSCWPLFYFPYFNPLVTCYVLCCLFPFSFLMISCCRIHTSSILLHPGQGVCIWPLSTSWIHLPTVQYMYQSIQKRYYFITTLNILTLVWLNIVRKNENWQWNQASSIG